MRKKNTGLHVFVKNWEQKTSVTSPYADLSLGLNDDYALGWFEPKSIRGHAESYMKFTYILLTARINKAENIVYDLIKPLNPQQENINSIYSFVLIND